MLCNDVSNLGRTDDASAALEVLHFVLVTFIWADSDFHRPMPDISRWGLF